jgi:signal transduction histidine kinase
MEQQEGIPDKIEQRTDELQALRDTIEILQAGLELSEVQDRILTVVREGLGYRMSILEIYDETGPADVLRIEKISGIPEESLKISEKLTDKPIIGATFSMSEERNLGVRAAKEGEPMTTDKLHDLFYPEIEESICEALQGEAGIKTIAVVPFQWEGKIVGNVFVGTEAEQISEEEIRSLQTIASQTAIAMDSAKRFSQTQQSLNELAALQETIRALLESTLDLSTVLDKILETVTKDLHFKVALLAVYDEPANVLRIEKFTGVPEILLKFGEAIMGMTLMGASISMDVDENLGVRAAKKGVPMATNKLHDLFRPVVSESLCERFQTILGAKAAATVPFKWGDKLVGNMFAGTERERVTEEEIKSLQAFANQAAIAIGNARLYESQKQLAEERQRLYEQAEKGRINGLKVSMMATLSNLILHDLNSELGKIRLLTGDERVQQKVDTVLKLIERLTAPVKEEMEIEPTDLNASVASVLADVRGKVPKNIRIEEDFTSDLPRVQASAHINEIFRILIKNAVDAMEKGGVLAIRTRRAEKDGRAEVLVTDTGRGIRKKDMGKLFDPKFTTKREKGSLGVGLYLAKSFLDMMNGEIKVESKVGKGTTFTISLLTEAGKETIRE